VFEFKQIRRPQVIILEVNTDRYPIYIEPNEQVWVTVDGTSGNSTVIFTEGLVAENAHLQNWFNNYGWVGDRMPQNNWYEKSQVGISPTVESAFLAKPSYLRVDHAINFYKEAISEVSYSLPTTLNASYRRYIKTYVKHAAAAMLYNLVLDLDLTQDDKQKIAAATLTNFFDVNERTNSAFIPHLKAYVEYETVVANQTKADFNQYFYFVWQNASQIPKQLKHEYLLFVLQKELSEETVQKLKPTVEAFAKSLSSLDQMAVLLDDYQEAITKANGREAPNFTLENVKGEMISLESLQGENIYLAFWSSSCKPCIEGMIKSRENKRLLQNENITFLYISTDLSKSTWLSNKHVKNAGSNDLHLWIGKSQPELHEYNAITLPTYYFIDKEGNFVTRFPNSWDPEFVKFVSTQS